MFELPELALNLVVGSIFANFSLARLQIEEFTSGIVDAFNTINRLTFNIDFSRSTSTLERAREIIIRVIRVIEAGFAWLYDRVIGNSSWPDRDWETTKINIKS